ncbi:TPA: hypothetical protein LA468_003359 [Clostridium botulinum]|nr:hypothetical protein [Clostridium botulinum]
MKLFHKLRLMKWSIQNYALKIKGKQTIHYPTKPYLELLKELRLDKYIKIVSKSFNS